MKQSKLWRVTVTESSGRWSAWLDLPTGLSLTSYYPQETKAGAQQHARWIRRAMRALHPPRKKKGKAKR